MIGYVLHPAINVWFFPGLHGVGYQQAGFRETNNNILCVSFYKTSGPDVNLPVNSLVFNNLVIEILIELILPWISWTYV